MRDSAEICFGALVPQRRLGGRTGLHALSGSPSQSYIAVPDLQILARPSDKT
jgi:hypothetical protein